MSSTVGSLGAIAWIRCRLVGAKLMTVTGEDARDSAVASP